MTFAQKNYQKWLDNPALDEKTRQELREIGNLPEEIEERFYQELQFGTAGLRGILGAGSNRMNDYTVARAAEGFARVIAARGEEAKKRGIAISYDSRIFSDRFAELTAGIFCAKGIRVRLSDELRPVPLLSFAIRRYRCAGGVMITASHNPREYNGFKVYGEDGGQLPPADAALVAAEMEKIEDVPALLKQLREGADGRASEYLESMGRDLDDAYDEMALKLAVNREAAARHSDLEIIYTPLHGSGNKPVRRILSKLGMKNVTVVPEQELPDGTFPTCAYPNPEARAALEMGIALAEKRNADLLIATDPDADRTGIAVRTRDHDFVVLSGNEIGILLMDYILSAKRESQSLPERSFCVSTVVSSRLPNRICEHYGVQLYRSLTGFKFIAEVIARHDEEGDEHFQFGYEESFGYLAGTDVRDKDAVITSMLIAEMAAESADRGETLYERLQKLFMKFGYAAEQTISLVREGKAGLERIAAAMKAIREEKTSFFGKLPVRRIYDFKTLMSLDLSTGSTEKLDYAESNVLLYELDGLDWFACRPSGTEPKLKIYMGTYRDTPQSAKAALAELKQETADRIEKVLGN